jgi:hypothetical protein
MSPEQNAALSSAPEGQIRIFLTSTAETGFADYLTLPSGSTIKDLWARHMGTQDPSKYVIRVERQPGLLAEDFLLEDGDRITITPHKVAGAEKPGFLKR